ncbi:MAG: GIY-YIG nuclease family protein [Thermoprotei archaeon]
MRSYLLFVRCDREVRLRTRSKEFLVPKGELIYVGSCRKGCVQRVSRHLSSEKKPFWHVDFLLAECDAKGALFAELGERELARLLSACGYVPGFGNSDDPENPSHLFVCPFSVAVRLVTSARRP